MDSSGWNSLHYTYCYNVGRGLRSFRVPSMPELMYHSHDVNTLTADHTMLLLSPHQTLLQNDEDSTPTNCCLPPEKERAVLDTAAVCMLLNAG